MSIVSFLKRIHSKFKKAIRKRKFFYVFGDSHTEVFSYINLTRKEELFKIVRVDGATALGMVHPKSKTNALELFMREINGLHKKSRLIFLLGEVDLGFLLWYRNIKLNLDVSHEMEISISNYITFLSKLKQRGFKNIYVMSPSPPCISDDFIETQMNLLRREIKINQVERVKLAKVYNETLKTKVLELRMGFIDLFPMLIDEQAHVVKKEYIKDDKNDHHLESSTYSQLVFDQIDQL